MEGIGLPQVVRQLRLKPPPVHGWRLVFNAMLLEEPVHAAVTHPRPLTEYFPLPCLFHEHGQGEGRLLPFQGEKGGSGLFV